MTMAYVHQSLTPGEELIHIGRFHWMYTFSAIMAIVWGIVGCIGTIVAAIYFEKYMPMQADHPAFSTKQVATLPILYRILAH